MNIETDAPHKQKTLLMGHFHSAQKGQDERRKDGQQHGPPAAMFGGDRGGNEEYRHAC